MKSFKEFIEEGLATKVKDAYHHIRYVTGGSEKHKYAKSKYGGKKPETHHDPYKHMTDAERGHTVRAKSSETDDAREYISRRDNPRAWND